MDSGKVLRLGVLSFTSLILYLLLVLNYPLAPSLADPRAAWASMVEATWANAFNHLLIYSGLFLIYCLALRYLTSNNPEDSSVRRWQNRVIIFTWLACSGFLLFAAPAGESHDIFDYTFRGRMMTEYQSNPLVDVPADFNLSTPFSRYLAWRKNVDTYGPVWESASAAISSSVRFVTKKVGWWDENYPVCPKSPESCRLLIAYITGYRMLAIALTGVSGWLIYSMVGNSRSQLSSAALAAWLLNPLTLMATALGGHNDAVMLVLVILSWWFFQRQQPILALLALIMGAHVKLTALIWLPAGILWIVWRWGWRRALKICLVSLISGLVISWFLYLPFGGWQTLPRMLDERSKFFANSWWRIFNHQLRYRWDWSIESAQQLSTILPNALSTVGAIGIPLWMFNFRPKRWRSEILTDNEVEEILWRALTAVTMLYLFAGTFWFQHWYVLWALAPAVLLPDSRLVRFTLPWLAFGAMSSNVGMSFLMATWLKTEPRILRYISEVAMVWGPVIVASGVNSLTRWRKKRKSALQPQ